MKKYLLFVCALGLLSQPVLAADDIPLVIITGLVQRIPSGDNLKVPSINGLTQCLHASAAGVITGTGADCGTGSGSVTTSGSPGAGNLTKFSGATAITNGDLSGDCTTSGTLAVTCGKTGGVSFGAAATLGVGAGLSSSGGNIVNNAAAVSGAVKSNGAGTMTQAACADLSNGAASCSTDATNASNIGSGTLNDGRLNADVVITSNNNTFTKAQRGTPVTVAISTSTFTPSFDAANNFSITLVHASCPCTFANPSTTPVAGQSGILEVIQSATGSDTIGTWGSQYVAAGGVTTLVLSTAAGAKDYLSYYVVDATHILVSVGGLNASH